MQNCICEGKLTVFDVQEEIQKTNFQGQWKKVSFQEEMVMEQTDGICRLSNLHRPSLHSLRQMHNHQSTKWSDSSCHSCRQRWDPRGSESRGPVPLCQGPAGVGAERCQAEGNQARRKLILFEVSQCQIKQIKDLFRVKQRGIKEASLRFQSKPFVQFTLFSLVPPFARFLHQSQQNGHSRKNSSFGFLITKETEIKATWEAQFSCLHHHVH